MNGEICTISTHSSRGCELFMMGRTVYNSHEHGHENASVFFLPLCGASRLFMYTFCSVSLSSNESIQIMDKLKMIVMKLSAKNGAFTLHNFN